MTPLLKIQNLNFSYGEVQALRDVKMEVPEKSIVCVMGRNGVGKTTLLRNITGLEKPDSGEIQLGGKAMTHLPAYGRARSGIGYVPQGRMIFPKLTVEENLIIGLSGGGDQDTDIFDEIYDLFPVLQEMKSRRGGDLSGGQQQQLAIGRALATDPKLLILDEPTEGIQPNIIQQIGKILQHLVDEKDMTILIVEQYLDFVREFSHHFYIMNRGRIVEGGETRSLTEELVNNYLSV
ncbi:MAG: urea ABC transporter ATP-binding subunit UrtE [Opitutae bacterium]|jgi:urea transport system ATP-binding protein|nr:urea ABC transporter ATP-binding subunit UrtE [Opitutae bacterium]MBT5378778.1 urea ABC transporter ATP-binding subunit UrtE [Opitutae bacterium]MBT5692747.1 urea ABC transporter ATP-binding subunit UrtE [Opitutae bacterium]